jgi:hypothetical protein
MPFRSVNESGVSTWHIRNAAQSAGSNRVSELVVDLFEAIQLKQSEGKRPPAPVCSLDFPFEGITKLAVVGETCEGIGYGVT